MRSVCATPGREGPGVSARARSPVSTAGGRGRSSWRFATRRPGGRATVARLAAAVFAEAAAGAPDRHGRRDNPPHAATGRTRRAPAPRVRSGVPRRILRRRPDAAPTPRRGRVRRREPVRLVRVRLRRSAARRCRRLVRVPGGLRRGRRRPAPPTATARRSSRSIMPADSPERPERRVAPRPRTVSGSGPAREGRPADAHPASDERLDAG